LPVVRAVEKRNFARGEAVRTHQQAFSVSFKNIGRDCSYERRCFSERYNSTSPVYSSDHALPTAAVWSVRAHSHKVNWCLLHPNRKTVRHPNAQFSSFSYYFLLVVKQFLCHFLPKHPVSLRTFRTQIILKHIFLSSCSKTQMFVFNKICSV
jgi:hypothetical protein